MATAVAIAQTAERNAEQHPADEQEGQSRREGDHQVRDDQQGRKAHQQMSSVNAARKGGDQQAGDHADDGGGGHRLAGCAFADAEFGGDWRQQAGGQEFRRHQAEDAERHGDDRAPGRRVRGSAIHGRAIKIGSHDPILGRDER